MSNPGWNKPRLGRIHDVMTRYVECGAVPGLVTLLDRGGEVHVDVIGSLAAGGSEPMRRDTIFRISSMTKPITAVAVMLLVEECLLRLDEPVDRLLPELANRQVLKRLDAALDDTVPAQRPISLRDLLTFCFGFGELLAPPDAYPILKAASGPLGMGPPAPAKGSAPDEWMRRLGALPLMYQPGERWLYNTGFDVLGVLIARASGEPFEKFLQERIFEPLGMQDTSFGVPADKLGRLATSYGTNPTTHALEIFDEAAHGQWSRSPVFPSGGAGLCSTADDFLAFSRMLLNNGKHANARLLSRASVETMTIDQLTPAQKARGSWVPGQFDNHGWGFGVSVVTRRSDVAGTLGTYGWDGGLGTCWRADPKEQLSTLLLTQAAWTSPNPPSIARDFWTCAYQALDD
jgi:CubicO group peptidase (beta-lactamase class C family)